MKSEKAGKPVKNSNPEVAIKPKDLKKKLILSISILIAGFLFLVGGYFWYSGTFNNRIFPNVSIGNLKLGGLSKDKAVTAISEKTKDVQWLASIKTPDNSYDISSDDINLAYDTEKTYNSLYSIGRSGNFFKDAQTRLTLLFTNSKQSMVYHIDDQKYHTKLNDIFESVEKPVSDAAFNYIDGKLEIISEKIGSIINKEKLTKELDQSIGNIDNMFSTQAVISEAIPKITSSDLTPLQDKFDALLSDSVVLKSEVKNIEIPKDELFAYADIVAVKIDSKKTSFFSNTAKAQNIDYDAQININVQKIQQFLETLKSDINKDTKNAKLSFADGKASIFQSPEKGYKLDEEQTSKHIASLLLARIGVKGVSTEKPDANSKELDMVLTITDPDVSDTNIDKLGIKELVGTGTTNFAGSPNNRVFNITHGADQFHGLLIKPGDTLSAIGTIGDPSAETGYLPELVIKGNTTIPEYGGGLCQVSTTLFRAALNAGMEIVERSNHAYRVSYYEPPVGMDATIYFPKPDFIFRNNTKNYILVQTEISGNNITFNFYGTKDNRQVEISDPAILDTIPAPADRYVESTTLAAGEIKRKESSHPGAHASFHYKVTIDGKVAIDQDFLSYYTPWQALYYYGPGTTGIPGVADPTPAPTPASDPPPSTPPAPCVPKACNAKTPTCGETTKGDDGCGNPCEKKGDVCPTTPPTSTP